MKTILLDPLAAAHSSHRADRDFVQSQRTKHFSVAIESSHIFPSDYDR